MSGCDYRFLLAPALVLAVAGLLAITTAPPADALPGQSSGTGAQPINQSKRPETLDQQPGIAAAPGAAFLMRLVLSAIAYLCILTSYLEIKKFSSAPPAMAL